MEMPVPFPKHLSAVLIERRKALGLSQRQLGDLLALSQPRISVMEAHIERITVDQLFALFAGLDLELVVRERRKPTLNATQW